MQTSNPRTLKLSVTRNGGRLENILVNVSVSYSDDGIEALPGNSFDYLRPISFFLCTLQFELIL